MVEIRWHRRETRRQTEKTNINRKPYPELGCESSHPTVIQKSAEGILADGKRAVPPEKGDVTTEDSPRGRPERCPPEWTRVNDSGHQVSFSYDHQAAGVEMTIALRSTENPTEQAQLMEDILV